MGGLNSAAVLARLATLTRQLDDVGSADALPLPELRNVLRQARDAIIDLRQRCTALEGRCDALETFRANAIQVAQNHEARITALEQSP